MKLILFPIQSMRPARKSERTGLEERRGLRRFSPLLLAVVSATVVQIRQYQYFLTSITFVFECEYDEHQQGTGDKFRKELVDFAQKGLAKRLKISVW